MTSGPTYLYYRRLGLDPAASPAEIAQAYRRLAQRSHPDVHPGDPEAPVRFREITEAYEVLRDPTRRAAYDAGQRSAHGPSHGSAVVCITGSAPSRPLAGPSAGIGYPQPGRRAAISSSPVVPLRAGPVRIEGSEARDETLRPAFGTYGDDAFGRLVAALLDSLRRR